VKKIRVFECLSHHAIPLISVAGFMWPTRTQISDNVTCYWKHIYGVTVSAVYPLMS